MPLTDLGAAGLPVPSIVRMKLFTLDERLVEEVRRTRRDYAERFDYDVRALAADLRRLEQQHPERLVTYHGVTVEDPFAA